MTEVHDELEEFLTSFYDDTPVRLGRGRENLTFVTARYNGSGTGASRGTTREPASGQHEDEASDGRDRDLLIEKHRAQHDRDRGIDVRNQRGARRADLVDQREEDDERDARADDGEPDESPTAHWRAAWTGRACRTTPAAR